MQNNYAPLFCLFFLPILLTAQHHETVSDPYLPPALGAAPKVSPAYQFSGPNIFVTQVNVDANGNNILDDAANEPSLAVNPKDPSRMAIGWRQFDNIQSSFRQAGFGYSTDGGQHWKFPGVLDPGVFRSDPVLASDAEGRFYYNALTVNNVNVYHCDVYRSTSDSTWDEGVYAVGGDKAWMTIDQTEGAGKGYIYAHWSNNYSDCTNNSDFTRSINQGDDYEACVSFTPGIYWGTSAVGPDGTLYISGNGGAFLASGSAQLEAEPIQWDIVSFADMNADYQSWNGQSPNPGGLLGQNYIAVNAAPGPLHGQIYMLQSLMQLGANDPRDVMFTRSDDGGLTWSPAIRINDDNGGPEWQWFGTMSVAPNGRIDAVWLDTRDNPGTVLSSLYYSNSTDGGISWSPNERMSDAFDPLIGWPVQQKIGDYYHMVSDNNGAHLAWAATFNGEQDVYYARISLSSTNTLEPEKTRTGKFTAANPNPFSENIAIRYDIPLAGQVQVQVFNQLGELVCVLADQGQTPGSYSLSWSGLGDQGQLLPNGLYICRLAVDGVGSDFQKLVLMRK